jgi:hypothetical protein
MCFSNDYRIVSAKIFVFIIVVALMLGGCAATRTLDPNLSNESYKTTKQPHVLAIDGRKLIGAQTTARPGAVELTVVYGDALIESLKHALENTYEKVYVVKSQEDVKEYDYLMSVTNNITSSCGAVTCGLNSKTIINLQNSNSIVLYDKDFVDDFVWEEPGSAKALGVFAGLTLLITAPVLAPIAIGWECDELSNQISNSNDKVVIKVAESIATASGTGFEKLQSKDQVSMKLEKIKELFDKGLITSGDYDTKRKAILDSY